MPLIRPATREDVPALLDIYNWAVLNTTASYDHAPVSLEERQRWFDEKRAGGWPVLVAEDAGRVLGWSTYGPFRAKVGYRHSVEHSVYVAPEVQGRGLGSALLTPLIEGARAEGRHVMIAGVDAENALSLRFHERHGFRPVGRFSQVGHKFGRWLDLIFLERRLDDGPPEGR